MAANKRAELVFIPSPGAGHLASSVEAAKLLLGRDSRLSISILILKVPSDSLLPRYTDSLTTADRFRLLYIPLEADSLEFLSLIDGLKPRVKEAVSRLISASGTPLAGFVLDVYCSSMMDVADELGVPSYIFFTYSAAFLGFMLHIQLLHDEHKVDLAQSKKSDAVLDFPTIAKPLPGRFFPALPFLLDNARRLRKARGILVNSFRELEPHAVKNLSDGKNPPVYLVGPVLNLVAAEKNGREKEIMGWLDDQPPKSVIFLCFGSLGSFGVDQVTEIARALEHGNHRFLWSLRRPPPDKEKMEYPTDYEDPAEVLPAGFVERTREMGRVIGWAPQTEILSHPAVGGFVSHCGWNSTLESVWHGVPIGAWAMYAEQQFNAFELVEELELGVEIKMDFRKDSNVIVKAEEIERGIRCVMEHDSKVRTNVKEMSEMSKIVLMDGGSSISYLNSFVKDVMHNVP